MKISKHIHKLVTDKLDKARIVVWYDGEQAFGDFIHDFSAPNCRVVAVVSPQESRLRARREGDEEKCQMDSDSHDGLPGPAGASVCSKAA